MKKNKSTQVQLPTSSSIASRLRASIASFTKMKEELEVLAATAASAIERENEKIAAAELEKSTLESTLTQIEAVKGNIDKIIEPVTSA